MTPWPCSVATSQQLETCLCLLAGVDVVDTYALLATHVAAPVEDAVTLLLPFLSSGVMATTTAQQVTAVNPMRGDIACSVPCPKGSCLWVGLAKIGGVLIVDQIPLCRWLEKSILGPKSFYPSPRFPVLFNHHLRSTVIFILQVVTNGPKVRLGPPAGLDFAASRETMALAFQVHVVQNGLSRGEKTGSQQWITVPRAGFESPPSATWIQTSELGLEGVG